MGVYIKGMKMPEHCGYCRFRYDGICHALQKTQYSMEECPLVPLDDLVDVVTRLPDADVAPVVHGRWQGVSPTVDSMECSVCRYCIPSEEFETPFCPWCGAKMDGGTQG